MKRLAHAFLVILLFLCLIIVAVCLRGSGVPKHGGAGEAARAGIRRRQSPDPAHSPHVVVDTLNLTHWLRGGKGGNAPLTRDEVIRAIDQTAPTLKRQHPGRVMYVLKDRESQFNDEAVRAAYGEAAVRNGVYLYDVERYPDPPAGSRPTAEHSGRARDDFFMALLAAKWRCAVLTEDRLRDFDRFRASVSPFHVYVFAFWQDYPTRDTFGPIRRPIRGSGSPGSSATRRTWPRKRKARARHRGVGRPFGGTVEGSISSTARQWTNSPTARNIEPRTCQQRGLGLVRRRRCRLNPIPQPEYQQVRSR